MFVESINLDDFAGPGKFEGCPDYVKHAYCLGLDGGADGMVSLECGEKTGDVFYVTREDCAVWPDLVGCYCLVLWEEDSGFVSYALFNDRIDFEAWVEANDTEVCEDHAD